MKRANSGALEGDPSTPLSAEDFRRGGTLRATAGPRLGWKNGSPGPAETIKPIQEYIYIFLNVFVIEMFHKKAND